MTGSVLVYIFFALFLLFIVESIYFLKKKLSLGPVESVNGESGQNGGKLILLGGLVIVVLLIVSFGWLFLSKQKTPSPTISTKTAPTVTPTQILPSPTPEELVYGLPTVTQIPLSPTAAPTAKITSSKTSTPTKTPTPTKIPSQTTTPKPKVPTASPTNPPTGGPIGGPDTISPTIDQSTSSAVVVVPKMPVAGSIGQTLTLFFVAISSVIIGFIL